MTTDLLCFFAFDDYKSMVLEKNRPDYAMETFYGETPVNILKRKNEILSIEGVKSVEAYRVGEKAFLWYEGIEDNEILKQYEKLLTMDLLVNHFSKYDGNFKDAPSWIGRAFYTKIYGIEPNSELFNSYKNSISVGNIDEELFAKGKEIILMVPLYYYEDNVDEKRFSDAKRILDATDEDNRMSWLFEQTDSLRLSYSSRYKDYYYKLGDIKPGDTVYLSADREELGRDTYESRYATKELKVGGIIYYFPEKQIWPFSNSIAPYAVIGSINCMESVYPNSKRGLGYLIPSQMKLAIQIRYPYRYGNTLMYIYTDSDTDYTLLNSKLMAYTNENNYTLYNY